MKLKINIKTKYTKFHEKKLQKFYQYHLINHQYDVKSNQMKNKTIISADGNQSAEQVLEICNKYNSFGSVNFNIKASEFIADNDSIKMDEKELNFNDQKDINTESIEKKADQSK